MRKNSRILILSFGVFSIINTEMGVIGILPLIAQYYDVSISDAGLLVSMFALAVAFAGPIMPLLFSKMNQKRAMLMVLGIFTLCNMISAFTTNFNIALIARIFPAFFHPIYVAMALTMASTSVEEKDAPGAVSKVLMGVSAGMVIGVPIVSFIASTTSLQISMVCFGLVNALALIATLLWIPKTSVSTPLSYGDQVSCLKRPMIWVSILAVVFLNGSIFGVYSFFADYLGNVTHVSQNMISIMLLVYGFANMMGNMVGGRALMKKANQFVVMFPCLLIMVYLILFMFGELSIVMMIFTCIWGILAGAAGNINQYWITSVMSEALEFGNGLFLAATNLGTTLGTMLCGYLITSMNSSMTFVGGAIFVAIASVCIVLRLKMKQTKQQVVQVGV